jgi:hypothetical protein
MLSKMQSPLRIVPQKDGRQALEIKLDELEQPVDAYHADWYLSRLERRMAHFAFGKWSVGKAHLASVLEICVPQASLIPLRETLKKSGENADTDFVGQLEALAKTLDLEPEEARPAAGIVGPLTKEHSFAANFALLGFNENDAALSFYRFPPTFNVLRIREEDLSKIKVFPLVRVDTMASILLSFCRDVIQFALPLEGSK